MFIHIGTTYHTCSHATPMFFHGISRIYAGYMHTILKVCTSRIYSVYVTLIQDSFRICPHKFGAQLNNNNLTKALVPFGPHRRHAMPTRCHAPLDDCFTVLPPERQRRGQKKAQE